MKLNYWISTILLMRIVIANFNIDGSLINKNNEIRLSIRIIDLEIQLIVIELMCFAMINVSNNLYNLIPIVIAFFGICSFM